MIKRQQRAILLVALACLVVLVCTAQRMASLHALMMNATAVTQTLNQTQNAEADAPVTPCELSAKSLLASPPVLFEGALFAVALLMAILAALPVCRERIWPPRVISSPRLRVHLRLCVFRE